MQFNKNVLAYFAMITASDYYRDGTKLSQAGSETAAKKKILARFVAAWKCQRSQSTRGRCESSGASGPR